MAEGRLATMKGYSFAEDDGFRADIIERIMCDFVVDLRRVSHSHGRNPEAAVVDQDRFGRLLHDGVVSIESDVLKVNEETRYLVRSVASTFDAHLAHTPGARSRAV
jgi:oxygen-independent coproporphyrinogen-3 oxidase